MPKLVHSLPKYRRHRGSNQAVVTLGGRDHYLGPHGTKASKLEYDRLISEWLSSGRSLSFAASQSDITIVEMIAAQLRYAKDYYGTKPTSEYHRIKLILKHLKGMYGRLLACEFGSVELKALRQQLIASGNSRTYINANMKRLIRVFKWAAGEGMVSPLVPQTLALIPCLREGKCEARETEPVGPVDEILVQSTLPHMPEVVADMVRVQLLTGMRPGEVCTMRPCDLDRTSEVWIYSPAEHKTKHHGKRRVVPIGSRAQAVLLKYLARDPQANCFRPCDSEAKRRAAVHAERSTPLSCGNKPGSKRKRRPQRAAGEQYDTRSYGRAITRACDKAFPAPEGIENEALEQWRQEHRWSPNRLRHTAATNVRREFGLEAAQIILGHSQANVTQVYAERDLAKGIEVARKIG